MSKFADYEEMLRLRYCHLYGETGCSSWIRKERQKNVIKIGITLLLFMVLIFSDIAEGKNEYSNVLMNRSGEITGVCAMYKGK